MSLEDGNHSQLIRVVYALTTLQRRGLAKLQ